MIESFKEIFTGLERAHGVTKVGQSNGDGTKVQGKSFIKREPVTDELWRKHLQGTDSNLVILQVIYIHNGIGVVCSDYNGMYIVIFRNPNVPLMAST